MRAAPIRNERAAELQLHRAGFVSRVLADLIDLVVLCALWTGLLLLASVIRSVLAGSSFVVVSAAPVLEGPVSFAIAVLYLSYFWGTTGRTPGKQVLGLRVVDPARGPLGVGRAVARAVLYLLFPIGLLWVVVSRRNASVQDLLVRSAVAYDWAYRGPDLAASYRE
jgi:uncharacterized RDD family membrane protein YckC